MNQIDEYTHSGPGLVPNYIDVEQGTPEWMEMRKGLCTGSMVRHAIGQKKRQKKDSPVEYYQARHDYMIDIVTTRMTGRMSNRYVSRAMEDGIEREPLAIAAYENATGRSVTPGGFVYHPAIEWYGSSPDGRIGMKRVLEAKCPTQATHLRYIMEYRDARDKGIEYVPEEYVPQVKCHLSCCDQAEVCDFVSYHPDFPKHLQLIVSPWTRDAEMIAAQDAEVVKFLTEAAELEKSLKELRV